MKHNPLPGDVVEGRVVQSVREYGPGILFVEYAPDPSYDRHWDVCRSCECGECIRSGQRRVPQFY